jgi:hypothetical protein
MCDVNIKAVNSVKLTLHSGYDEFQSDAEINVLFAEKSTDC